MSTEKVNPFLRDETQWKENPLLRDENNIRPNTKGFEDTINKFKKSTTPIHKEVVRILEKLKPQLANKNLQEVSNILSLLSINSSQEELLKYLKKLNSIQDTYISENENTRKNTKRSGTEIKEETEKKTPEVQEEALEQKYYEDFWENWWKIKEIWNIESREDYTYLEKTMDLWWQLAFNILDGTVDTFQLVAIEWVWKIGLKYLYESLKFIVKKDLEFAEYLNDQWHYISLFLLIYVHINSGVVGYRYLRDYLASNYGDAINKTNPIKGKQKKVTEDGKERVEVIETDRLIKRIFWSRYLDAVDTRSNIFSLNEGSDNLSENQNEYLKRRKTMDILKKYYFDNPELYKRLQRIEVRYLQANSFTYWREIYFLLKEHGIIRRIIGGALKPELPLIGKKELEQATIRMRENLQRDYFQAIRKLYNIRERSDSLGVEVDKDNPSNFLEGLKSSIEHNPHIAPKEKTRRLAYLDAYLNRITSGTEIVSEETIFQELMRISDGEMTKSDMLKAIETELGSTKKLSIIAKVGTSIRNKLLRRTANLEKLQKRVANGDRNETQEEFLKTMEKVKKSRVFISLPKQKKDFIDQDIFISEKETTKTDIEQKQKIYTDDSIKWLENYIKYMLPNKNEEAYTKILNAFKDRKTPYDEQEFYRELNRMKNGFLPSNELLEELENVKEKLLEEKLILEKQKNKNSIIKKLSNLKMYIKETQSKEMPVSRKIKFRESIDFSIFQLREWDYKWAITTLWDIAKRSWGQLKQEILEIIQKIRNLKNIRVGTKIEKKNNVNNIDEKIEKISGLIQETQNSELDMKKSDVKNLSSETILDFEVEKHISPKFSKKDKEVLKKSLHENKNTSHHDFKSTLEKSGNPTEIKWSIDKLYWKEFNLVRLWLFMSEDGANPKWIDDQIWKLANSIHTNDYTIGQIREMLWKIIAWEEFDNIDINKVIETTSNHSAPFEGKEIINFIAKEYDSLDADKKLAIWAWLVNQNIPNEHLPENITNDIKKRENFNANAEKVNTQKSELQRMIQELEDISDKDDAKAAKTEFDNYIKEERINRNSETYKDIIKEFTEKHTAIKASLWTENPTPTKPEAEKTTNKQPESKEKAPDYDSIKAHLDEIYPSILIHGDEKEIQKVYDEYSKISDDSEYLNKVAKSQNINDYYKNMFRGIDVFSIRELGALKAINVKLAAINAKFAGATQFTDISEMIDQITDKNIKSNIIAAIKEMRISK